MLDVVSSAHTLLSAWYGIDWFSFIEDIRLTTTERCLFEIMLYLEHKHHGPCPMTDRTIKEIAPMSTGAISQGRRKLERLGYIRTKFMKSKYTKKIGTYVEIVRDVQVTVAPEEKIPYC